MVYAVTCHASESAEIPEVFNVSFTVEGNIGIIRIPMFHYKTYEQTAEILEVLNADGIVNIIIDIRNNFGGLLEAAMDVFRKGSFLLYIMMTTGCLFNTQQTGGTWNTRLPCLSTRLRRVRRRRSRLLYRIRAAGLSSERPHTVKQR
jgi:hypothetical protein